MTAPTHTPAQVAAAVQAERAAIATDVKAIRCSPVGSGVRDRIVEVILARGDTSALDAAVEAARREEREHLQAALLQSPAVAQVAGAVAGGAMRQPAEAGA